MENDHVKKQPERRFHFKSRIIQFISIYMTLFVLDSCNSRSEDLNYSDGIEWSSDSTGHFIDPRDGKQYAVVKIKSQIWFAENLAYRPKRGDFFAIDDNPDYVSKYGYLYFWETAKDACPKGWHLPSMEEWDTLIQNLGGKAVAGGHLKSTHGWKVKSENTSNISGMSILPAGNKAVGGSYFHLGDDALLWTSTVRSDLSSWKIRLRSNSDSVGFQACSRLTGLSVRCIRD